MEKEGKKRGEEKKRRGEERRGGEEMEQEREERRREEEKRGREEKRRGGEARRMRTRLWVAPVGWLRWAGCAELALGMKTLKKTLCFLRFLGGAPAAGG